MPILDAALVARHLQVHERTARRLLNEAAEAAVITEIMGRYQYRIWAAPSLAQWAHSTRMDRRERVPKATRSSHRPSSEMELAKSQLRAPQAEDWDRAEKDERLQAMLDDLDALSRSLSDVSEKTTNSITQALPPTPRPASVDSKPRQV